MLVTRGSGGGQSTINDEANVCLGSGEDFPDVMRIDCLRRIVGRDGLPEQVVEWIEPGGIGCTLVPSNLQGNQQHLRRGLLDVSCDADGEILVVDDGNASLDRNMIEGPKGSDNRDDRIGLKEVISLGGHHDGRITIG